jgi:hypothetical protein
MRRLLFLVAASLLLLSEVGQAKAGVFDTSVPFNVSLINDPAGNTVLTTGVPLNGGPTIIDNGLLSITESITPLDPTSAIIQFTLTTTSGSPLAGNPGGLWQTLISGFQTTGPASLMGPFYYTFVDANGVSDPILFPGYSLAPNPTDATQVVAETIANNTPRIVHSLQLTSNQFDQPPTFYENGGIVPTTFVMGGEFVLAPNAPEPASFSLLGIGIVGMAGYKWRRRKLPPA